MSPTNCKKCGWQFTENSAFCPSCGCPNDSLAKKFGPSIPPAIVFVAIGLVVLIGGLMVQIDTTRNNFHNLSRSPANAPLSPSPSNENANSTSFKAPAGMSAADNLAAGKEALSRNDQHTAWKHLFEIKTSAKEFPSAKELLANIGAREQIRFELEQLAERETNLQRISTGLASKVDAPTLKKMLDNGEKQLRQIHARRQELMRKLQSMS